MVIGQSLPDIKCRALVKKAQGIPHRTVRHLRDIPDSLILYVPLFLPDQFREPCGNGIYGDPLEIIPLAAAQDRNRNLVRLRRRQDKYHIFRRFLQRLKKRVKSPYRQHMNLINNIYLIPPFCRAVRYFLPDLADIIHAVVRRRVDLDHIHRSSRRHRTAHGTLAARTSVLWMLAIHRLGKYLRHASLTRSAGPAEQIRMPDAPRLDLVLQCLYNGVLPFHIFERIRPELPI